MTMPEDDFSGGTPEAFARRFIREQGGRGVLYFNRPEGLIRGSALITTEDLQADVRDFLSAVVADDVDPQSHLEAVVEQVLRLSQ